MVETTEPSAVEVAVVKPRSSDSGIDKTGEESEARKFHKEVKLREIVNLTFSFGHFFDVEYSGQVVFEIDGQMYLITLSRISPDPRRKHDLSNWRIEDVIDVVTHKYLPKMEIEGLLQEEHGVTLSDIVEFRLSEGELR